MASIIVEVHVKEALDRIWPSLEWAMESGLLDEDAAADILVDEILSMVSFREEK